MCRESGARHRGECRPKRGRIRECVDSLGTVVILSRGAVRVEGRGRSRGGGGNSAVTVSWSEMASVVVVAVVVVVERASLEAVMDRCRRWDEDWGWGWWCCEWEGFAPTWWEQPAQSPCSCRDLQ